MTDVSNECKISGSAHEWLVKTGFGVNTQFCCRWCPAMMSPQEAANWHQQYGT